ncbi:MAG: molybdopterin molybdotransferase MoeA [Alphaproteobacteria bacterium]|nr:molybdopterin molybdotransferase MoeA [Alphaproteobacteria bacterium]
MALLPVEDALTRILATAQLLPPERLALAGALGRVTALDIKARRDQPPFAASAMDGFALRHADVAALPARLKVTGLSAAGHGFKGTVRPGEAVRILTGAPLPKGADTVVIQENTSRDGDALEVIAPTAFGKNIRRAALDFAKGDILVPAATRLNARDIGLAASGNVALLRVRRKPVVAVLTTGDELALPGTMPKADQITSSNNHALAAYAESLGAEVMNLGIVPDKLATITRAIAKAAKADVLITTGGASVGDTDFIQEALRRAGVKIDFWKIAMRPGKPFMFGTKGKLRVLGLPGNPVAALVCARLFLKPLLAKMAGLEAAEAPVLARLGTDLAANDQRQDYLRATLEVLADGTRVASAAGIQDSSMQRVMRQAGCLIIRPPHAPAAKAGELHPILLLDW